MKGLLLTLARALVERPDRVSVEEWSERGATVLALDVAPEDRGSVIGRGGSTADALRVLLSAVAGHTGRRCRLEILG